MDSFFNEYLAEPEIYGNDAIVARMLECLDCEIENMKRQLTHLQESVMRVYEMCRTKEK